LHPDEAGPRGLRDGQLVRLFNDRGSVGLVLKVSDEIQPGIVLVPGQRPDGDTVAGTINILCSDRYTDTGEGATTRAPGSISRFGRRAGRRRFTIELRAGAAELLCPPQTTRGLNR
jgi:predicted molibdopterin-dependent oxidoreductase YjgC